jgi:hypothetical protein
MKFCKTPISGLFGFSSAYLSGVSGLIKSLYLPLQLFGLVGQIFCFERLVNRFGSKDPDPSNWQSHLLGHRDSNSGGVNMTVELTYTDL